MEVLDRKMGLLRTDIATQAAAAAEAHKFNSGSLEPSGDCTPEKLASGVAATAQVCIAQYCICSVHCYEALNCNSKCRCRLRHSRQHVTSGSFACCSAWQGQACSSVSRLTWHALPLLAQPGGTGLLPTPAGPDRAAAPLAHQL